MRFLDGMNGTRTGRALAAVAVVCCLSGAPAIGGDLEEARKALSELRPGLGGAMLPSTSLQAIGSNTPAPLTLRHAVVPEGFMKRHLMPRVSHQLGRVTPIHALETDRAHWQQSELHDWFSGSASHQAERGLHKAARQYLVDETAVGTFIESLRFGGRRDVTAPVSSRSDTTDYGVGVSQGRPNVELRHRSGAGTTRFRVGVDGSLRLSFRPAGVTHGRFSAGYDAQESSYSLSFRHSY